MGSECGGGSMGQTRARAALPAWELRVMTAPQAVQLVPPSLMVSQTAHRQTVHHQGEQRGSDDTSLARRATKSPVGGAVDDVIDHSREAGAGDDVVGLAAQGVLGHHPRALDLVAPFLEAEQMLLEDGSASRHVGIEERADLLEGHAGGLVPCDDGDADEVVGTISAVAGGVPRRCQQPDVLPVAQDRGLQPEASRRVVDEKEVVGACLHVTLKVQDRGMAHPEIVIIGGGPAGLQAALSLGRIHRTAVVLDDGQYRNASVSHMHNVLGADGTAPQDFRARAREQLDEYETVAVRREQASEVTQDDGGFVVRLAGGQVVHARALILATGVRDELPAVPGLQALWGRRAAQCPFCHAHEFAGGRFGILGLAAATHLAPMLSPVAGSITVLPLSAEAAQAPTGLSVAGSAVVGMRDTGAAVEVTLADGRVETVDVVFAVPTLRQRAPFAERLGLEFNPSGCVRVDEFHRASQPGVFAAGDMAHQATYPMPMASVVAAAAAGQLAASAATMHLLMS
jgi:thioredoxin reductase